MIFDSISNFKNYQNLHTLFRQVVPFLDEHRLQEFPIGKHELENGINFTVSEYLTKDRQEGYIECHQKYIDIQLLTRGSEKIGICHKNDCTAGSYDEDKDYQKLKGSVDWLILQPGYFMIFFPQDGHMPQIRIGRKPELVRKIVFKVPITVGSGQLARGKSESGKQRAESKWKGVNKKAGCGKPVTSLCQTGSWQWTVGRGIGNISVSKDFLSVSAGENRNNFAQRYNV